MDIKLLSVLVCPLCKGPLDYKAVSQVLICHSDRLSFPIKDNIPIMLEEQSQPFQISDPAASS